MLGQLNQRSQMRGMASGVQTLTITRAASTAKSRSRACSRARSATSPSVFIDQPRGAEQRVGRDRRDPVKSENGDSQSNVPPAKALLSTVMPCRSPPRMTPCMNAAVIDPPMNERSHSACEGFATQRNSKATPPEHQRQKHDDHRQIERRHDDAVGGAGMPRTVRRRRAPARSRCRPRTAPPSSSSCRGRVRRDWPGTGCRCRGRSRRAST